MDTTRGLRVSRVANGFGASGVLEALRAPIEQSTLFLSALLAFFVRILARIDERRASLNRIAVCITKTFGRLAKMAKAARCSSEPCIEARRDVDFGTGGSRSPASKRNVMRPQSSEGRA